MDMKAVRVLSYADVWVHSPDVAWIAGESRVVVFDLHHVGSVPLALEGSAAAIWMALDGVMDTEAIMDFLSATFGVPRREIDFVVISFLRDLRRRGLISLRDIREDAASDVEDRGVLL